MAILRPFNTFGPRQSARAIIPTIISQALTRPGVSLGSLDPRRDLTYVKDTVPGFVAIAGCDAAIGRVVNVGRGEDISIGELVERIAARLGRPIASRPTPSASAQAARSAGCWPARRGPENSGAGSRGTRSTRRSTRPSPGSATTSPCSGSTSILPEAFPGLSSAPRVGSAEGSCPFVRFQRSRPAKNRFQESKVAKSSPLNSIDVTLAECLIQGYRLLIASWAALMAPTLFGGGLLTGWVRVNPEPELGGVRNGPV